MYVLYVLYNTVQYCARHTRHNTPYALYSTYSASKGIPHNPNFVLLHYLSYAFIGNLFSLFKAGGNLAGL